MPSLHIEHAITDLSTWTAAFDRFADARRSAGVRSEQVRRPVDDECYVVVDLDFATVGEAESFLAFLTNEVWAVPANSPGLAGHPQTSILETIDVGADLTGEPDHRAAGDRQPEPRTDRGGRG